MIQQFLLETSIKSDLRIKFKYAIIKYENLILHFFLNSKSVKGGKIHQLKKLFLKRVTWTVKFIRHSRPFWGQLKFTEL